LPDWEYGSLISPPGNDAINADNIARNAALCGWYIFFSVGIGTESGKQLGSLEMYRRVSRIPSPRRLQLIERAACLAAVAIKRCWRPEMTATGAFMGIGRY